MTGKPGRISAKATERSARAERLETALRDNLKRRKAQSRARSRSEDAGSPASNRREQGRSGADEA